MAPDPFEFLDPWFTALDGLLVVADRHRMDSDGMIALGRDPETDWWLRVSWQKAFTMLVGDREQGHRQLLRWREALLLVGAFASVNNTVFVAKLCTLSGFLPAAFMELKTHALLPRIEVTATEQLCRLMQVYGVGLRDFCLLTDFSDEFMRDFTRLTALSSELVTMPRVRLAAYFTGDHTTFLELVESVAKEMRDRKFSLSTPGFILDSLDLDATRMFGDSSALKVLRGIVELGVPIDHIQLPDGTSNMGDRMLPPWREEWALFVCSLCANCETNPTPVNRITVDSSEIAHPDFVMLSSALQLARNVKHLVVGHDFVEDLDEDIPDALPPGIWDLISLALMSNDSTTSVEALTIRGIPISDEDVGGITDMVTYSFPLSEFAAQWVMDDNPSRRPESRAPRTVRVTAGTTLTGHYGFDEEEYSFTINDATEALSVREEGELSYLFIRGRGFCYVPSSELPSKRARFTRLKREPDHGTSALLKFIEIVTSRNDAISPSHIADFVDNAGGLTLRCLKLRVPNLSEEALRAIMSTNPHLEHLVVSHLSLTSMAFIEDAIQSEVPLQSLALSKLSVAEDNLNAFLDKALSHDSKTRLQKLRLGPLAESTLEKLGTLLKVSSLRYLHCESSRPAPPSFEALVSYHHSESTGKVRVPLPNSSKVAFLEAMHHFTNLGIVLTDEMKAMICFLASTPDTRIVICSDLE